MSARRRRIKRRVIRLWHRMMRLQFVWASPGEVRQLRSVYRSYERAVRRLGQTPDQFEDLFFPHGRPR